MLDHISFGVADLDRSTAFCDAALKPLGLERMFERPRAAAHGAGGKCFPW
jgi:catechol 2,3-dioxygenase-like lactoylglutathione lyase family enzyme